MVKGRQYAAKDPAQLLHEINEVNQSELGKCNDSNRKLNQEVIQKIIKLREKYNENDFQGIQYGIQALVKAESFLEVHENLKGITEFVMKILVIYEVPIQPDVPEQDDAKLRQAMTDALGK